MKSIRSPYAKTATTGLVALAVLFCTPMQSHAQVRTKKPDRSVYRAPTMEPVTVEAAAKRPSKLLRAGRDVEFKAAPSARRTDRQSNSDDAERAKWGAPLVDAELTDAKSATKKKNATQKKQNSQKPNQLTRRQPQQQRAPTKELIKQGKRTGIVRRDPIQLPPPHRPQHEGDNVIITGGEVWVDEGEVYHETESFAPVLNPTCDAGCVSCDGGCDAIATNHWYNWWNSGNAYLSFAPDRWFGSAELLLMFRKGDVLPPLVTTSTDDNPDPDTAGQLREPGTQILVGGTALKDMTAGGRFALGTWLDCNQCRSLVIRGWFAGEESFSFSADQNGFPVLARPFFNVTDGLDPFEQDTQLVAFPDRTSGAISVSGDSNVYGADVSVRQFYHGQYGGTIDVLYGYQFMRLDENLAISSTATSLDEDFAPVGSVISVFDSFDVKNEFHGGQLGVASRYREGCWSFRGLFKIGFGGLSRRADLRGQTTTTIDDATAVDPNGLLVRSTNQGNFRNSIFAWAPELDLTLGWQRFPLFDVTFGYHISALTDALQVSGAIDPELAVNLADPPVGRQNPAPNFRYDTYYVQGIHFGVQYIY